MSGTTAGGSRPASDRARLRRPLAVALAVLLVAAGGAGLGAAALAGLGPFGGGEPAAPRFVDETATAGVDQAYDGGSTFFTGGGVAVLDCDSDGRPDLYLAGGANPAALYRNDGAPGGRLHFARVPGAATDLRDVTGAYPLDVDGDGITDLAVLRVGENVLLRGLGGCRFERANEAWGFDGGDAWSTAFSATWEGDARLPTLAIGNYLALDAAGAPTSNCADNELVRPAPGGAAYGAPIVLRAGATCASATTATTTSTARSSCGGWRRARRRGSTRPRTAGCRSRSGAWASPAST